MDLKSMGFENPNNHNQWRMEMDNTKLLRMDNFEDDLCGIVSKLTNDEIKYLKKINEFEGEYFVDLMSDGENLVSQWFYEYETAVNQLVNFVSCTAWKKDKTQLAWDILREKLIA